MRLTAAYATHAARVLRARCTKALHSSLSQMHMFVDAAATSDVRLAQNTSICLPHKRPPRHVSCSNLKGAVCGFKSDTRTALELLHGVLRQGNRNEKKSSRAGTKMTFTPSPPAKPPPRAAPEAVEAAAREHPTAAEAVAAGAWQAVVAAAAEIKEATPRRLE